MSVENTVEMTAENTAEMTAETTAEMAAEMTAEMAAATHPQPGQPWQPGTLTDAQTAGLLSLSELWLSLREAETLGRARAAVEILERRQRDLALEIALAREQAAREVQREVQTLAATFQRAREQAVLQATELAWDIADILVETSAGPSPALRQQVLAFLRHHQRACLRVPPTHCCHFDDLMGIHVIPDERLSPGSMEIDLPDGRLSLHLAYLREIIQDDTNTYITSSLRRVHRKPCTQAGWGDA